MTSSYVSTPQYVYAFHLAAWGWVYLLLGVVIAVAGVVVVRGQAWGRFVGIGLAALSMVANFLFLPHYPLCRS